MSTEKSIFDVDWLPLVKEIYSSCTLYSATYDGVTYFSHKTMWNNGVIEGRPGSDPHQECKAYADEECKHIRKQVKYPSKIKYDFNHGNLNAGPILGVDDPWKVKFVGGKLQIDRSPGYPNEDHRGSDHFSIELPYETRTTIQSPFTLEDFINALFLLKSHKTDGWYELYILEKDHSKFVTVDKEAASVQIQLSFDYGS